MERENARSEEKKRLHQMLDVLRRHDILSKMTPQKLVAILGDLGPTFIKLGQILSMQPALPPAYCRELAKLRVQVAPMPMEQVEDILQSEYGEGWQARFASLDNSPLGSASIAQVHKATLANGMQAVIKVQRPGIYEEMSSDILLLREAVKILKYIPLEKTLDFSMVLDELWEISKQEMDFRVEAENILEFSKSNEGIAYITCPRVSQADSTAKVLVMEYIEGWPIDRLDALKENGYDPDEIARRLADNYVKQIVEDGFFHADPHSGNILIRDGKIVWIDLGMMGRLSPRDRELIRGVLSSIAENDIPGIVDFALKIGQYEKVIDRFQLQSEVELFFHKYGDQNFADMDVPKVLEDFFGLLHAHGIALPKGVSMLGRSMVTIQGTLRSISESINLGEVIAAYMSRQAFSLDELRKTAVGLLHSLGKSAKKSVDIPAQLSDALRAISSGTSRVHMDLDMSEEMDKKLNRILNKLIQSIVLAALLVGSSLICATNLRPLILGIPWIAFAGFVLAGVIGVRLLFAMYKGR